MDKRLKIVGEEETSSDIQPIQEGSIKITSKEQIRELVEEPLVATVEALFDKSIETYMSSANGSSIGISLYYDSLTTENKARLKQLRQVHNIFYKIEMTSHTSGRPVVSFFLPAIDGTPTSYIEKWGSLIADNFTPQRITMPITMTYTRASINEILNESAIKYWEQGKESIDQRSYAERLFDSLARLPQFFSKLNADQIVRRS